ncbi:uncharacterized protein V1518DRAFT_417987 [Limtongia smithiae]|uniref:uncharacterized protein n=1 Tax=Limtongia smithiae TaxID=1125753 RepID=UPI0034CF1224
MSDQPADSSAPTDDAIQINIKSAADQKFQVSASTALLVSEFKALLEPKCSIPKERQRLIYSGRVLKDHEPLSAYNIHSGHTIHLVKSAAPPASAGGAAPSAAAAAAPAVPAVPQNIAAGQGAGNPLAGLTGARYAGLAQLPSASMFGPDGGMGPPPSEDDIITAMSNPMVQQSMNQMLQNPQMLDYIINSSPNLQGMGPQVRDMMQSEQFRQMMTNPDLMRQMLSFNRNLGFGGFGGMGGMGGAGSTASSFPEPGRTGTTASMPATTATTATTTPAVPGSATSAAQANPFASLLPNQGAGANPFAALLANSAFMGQQQQTGGTPAAGAGGVPAVNPNYFAEMMSLMGTGAGAASPAQPEDTRPPEERYENQLRQLNELGFYDFDRNVRALRRSGGSVQGAVEALLDGLS